MKMRNIIITLILGIVFFSACEKDEDKVYISENPTAPTLQSPASPSGMTFIKDDAAEMIGFSWTAADFGFQASITYGVQLALEDDFSDASTILTTQDLTDSVSVADINGILLGKELAIGEAATIKCRVFAMVSTNIDSSFSASQDYTVTPYETLIDYPMIYVPGAYQGWSPGAENGRLYSYNFNDIYEGIIRLDGGDPVEFKIAPAANWDNSWGGTLTASGSDYTGTLDASGSNFSVAAGTYIFTVDVSALTIDMEATDDWGIIGSAVPPYDWSVDVNLFYNGQRQMWEVTGDFNAGEFKFRANDDWGINYGDSGADGSLDSGGDNIVLSAAGNYTIRLDLVNMTYSVEAN